MYALVLVVLGMLATATQAHAASRPSTPASGVGLSLQNPGGLVVSEAGVTDTFTIALSAAPQASVSVRVLPTNGQIAVSGVDQFTFLTVDWNVPQTVTVSAIDDGSIEGVHASGVSFQLISADPAFNALNVPTLSATVIDNDVAGVAVAAPDGSTDVDESGTVDYYTVVLTAAPAAPVSVMLDTADGQVSALPTSLTFTPSTWDTPQVIQVSAVNDAIAEGVHSGGISHTTSSSDARFNNLVVADHTVSITDNDVAAVLMVESGGSTAMMEGPGIDSVSLQLGSRPTAPVTVEFVDDSQVDIDVTSITFTAANWNVAQMLQVSATDDALDEASPHTGLITTTVDSADLMYNSFDLADIAVSITDNDTSSVQVIESGSGTAIAEGGATDTYNITLGSQPLEPVQVTLLAGNGVSVTPTVIFFSPADWSTAQSITVTATDDTRVEGVHTATVSHLVTSSDPRYSGIAVQGITATIADNDTADVIVSNGGQASVSEDGLSANITLRLAAEPSANVTITWVAQDDLSVSSPVMTFTPTNWSTAQSLQISAVDDVLPEGSPHGVLLVGTVASSDTFYAALLETGVEVAIDDNDVAALVVTPSDDSTQVAEGGANDTIDIALAAPTDRDVIVALTGDGQTDTASGPITFTSTNWNTPQTVMITAVDDSIDEDEPMDSYMTISTTSTNNEFDNLNVPDVEITVADNDERGITLQHTGSGNHVAEGGTTDTLRVRLDTQPEASVKFKIAGDAQLKPGKAQLTFTPATWSTRQKIPVYAVDDTKVEGDHGGSLSFTVVSADSKYNGLIVNAQSFEIGDNDSKPKRSSGGTGGSGGSDGSSGGDRGGGKQPAKEPASGGGQTSPSTSGGGTGASVPGPSPGVSTGSPNGSAVEAAPDGDASTLQQSGVLASDRKVPNGVPSQQPAGASLAPQRQAAEDRASSPSRSRAGAAHQGPSAYLWLLGAIPILAAVGFFVIRALGDGAAAITGSSSDTQSRTSQSVRTEQSRAKQQKALEKAAAKDIRATQKAAKKGSRRKK